MALFSSVSAVNNLTKIAKKKVEKLQGGYEFRDYSEYVAAFGPNAMPEKNWTGEDRAWLFSDRIKCRKRWRVAVNKITAFAEPGRLKPFGQILAYYRLVQTWVKGRKHEIVWLYGAYYLVEDLWEAYEDGIKSGLCPVVTSPELLEILKTLNEKIADFASTQFKRLLYTEYKNLPRKGHDAYDFDRDFILAEQVDIAFPVYNSANGSSKGKEALANMSDIYNGIGWRAWLKALDQSGISIPVFQGYYQSNLTEPLERFGQDSRVQVPLGILYPNSYLINDNDDRINDHTPISPSDRYYFNPAFRLALKKGSLMAMDPNSTVLILPSGVVIYKNRDVLLYNIYRIINKAIKNVFK